MDLKCACASAAFVIFLGSGLGGAGLDVSARLLQDRATCPCS